MRREIEEVRAKRAGPAPASPRSAANAPRYADLVFKLFSPAAAPLLRELVAADSTRAGGVPFVRAAHERVRWPWRRRDAPIPALAGRLSALLIDATRPDGTVDLPWLERLHGAEAAELVREVAAVDARPLRNTAAIHRAIASYGSDEISARLIVHASPIDAARREMGAFDHIARVAGRRRPLAGMKLLGIQHLVPDTGVLLAALVDAGIARRAMKVAGKPHSEDWLTMVDLDGRGYDTLAAVWRHEETEGQRPDLEANLRRRLEAIGPGERYLLLDDGGELIAIANQLVERRPELADRIVAVEQTRKGSRRLQKLTLRFPVIDVAQATAKLEYESPIIGHSIGLAVDEELDLLREGGHDPGTRILILGYGKVGRATATYFRARGYEVEAYDRDGASARVARRAARDGVRLHATLEEALARGQIVISATGETPIEEHNVHLLPDGAVLFNAASPGELAPALRDLDARSPDTPFGAGAFDFGLTDALTHRDRVLATANGHVLLVADGEVVNFQAPKPARYIQLTTGLLYLGAIQAARTHTPGLHALADRPQRRLVRAIERQLARTGESLLRPRFDQPSASRPRRRALSHGKGPASPGG
jgi:S-adenosylhomocysteine hydrolase